MLNQRKSNDAELKYASFFEEPPYDFDNHLALKIYNYIADGNQGLSADWFELFLNIYDVKDVQYFTEAVFIIRNTITNFDNLLERKKQEGEELNKQIMATLNTFGLTE